MQGVYSTPGIVWEETRSVGLSLILWVLGGVVSLFGCLAYTELCLRTRRGGGELVYLLEAFPYKRLMSYLFGLVMIIVIRPGSIVASANIFAQYIIYAIGSHDCLEASLHPSSYFTGVEFW